MLTHIDCFCGPGGFCTGLHAAGFKTKIAIDYVKTCTDTYKKNHPEVHVINDDIRNIKNDDILPHIPKEGVDLVTSGMPCETFSTAGNSSRSFYDERQVLFREGIRIAKISKAKMILFENVPAIRTKHISKESNKLVVDILKEELKEAGYENFKEFILSAKEYGVPQNRERYFVLATKNKKIKLESPKTIKKINTIRDAFAGLPNVEPNCNEDKNEYTKEESEYSKLMKNDEFWKRENIENKGLTHQHPMKHREKTLKRFSLIKKGENLGILFDRLPKDKLKKYQEEGILPKKKFIGRNIRLDYDSQSPTVTSHCLDEFLHPEFDRALTVRECARLQSFPDSYTFCGPYLIPHNNREIQDKYEQIGDAVPPLLAYAWGKTIKKLLE